MGRKAKAKSEGEREAILLRVFDLMCEGHSVEACGGILGMKAGTLRQWVMGARPVVREQYWVARRLWGSALADEAVEIARESVNASSTVDKLKIDTFLRLAGKANPQEYGDKQVVEHSGGQELRIKVVEENILTRREGLEENTGDKQARKKKKVTAVARIDRHAPDDMPG